MNADEGIRRSKHARRQIKFENGFKVVVGDEDAMESSVNNNARLVQNSTKIVPSVASVVKE